MADDPMTESETQEGGAAADTEHLRKLHDKALRRFDTVALPQAEMRMQALEARRFVTIPGAQWEGQWGEQFENAPRPEVDKITKSLEKIETDYRENRLTVDYIPANDASDGETANMLDGIHRADSYHFKAQQARDNAFQEGIRGGFGAYRLTTEYADPYDKDSDAQRINPGMTIVDADQSVYFDGGSKVYDKSDAMWAFVISAWQRDEAEDKWGSIPDWPACQLLKLQYDWYTPDVVRIAEYYEVEESADRLVILTNKLTGEEQRYFASEIEEKDIRDLTAQGWDRSSRDMPRRRVHKYIMSGSAVLKDCGFIAGNQIPIVPFYGRRDFVDNMERFRGHVQKKMDRQRIYNTRIAKLVETDSLAPREVPIFGAEQIDAKQADEWARANIDRLPYLTVHPLRNEDGSIASLGMIGKIDPPSVQPVTAALLQIASTDLSDEDDSADQVKANVSAEAMDIAAARVDAKSGIYLDNMRQTVQREAEIYLAMAREVYFEAGRKLDTLTEDGKDGQVELAQPSIDKSGVYKVRNDLSQGKYKVVADVVESTTTKRQKAVKQSLEVAQVAVTAQDMELAQVELMNAVLNMDGEGQSDIQAWVRNKLIALNVVKPTPEEQAQIQQAQQAAGEQQPSPADQALMAQAGKLASDGKLSEAKAIQTLADAHLKTAQADAIGGPEQAPQVPTGLQAANDGADVAAKLAGADLKTAQAAHLRHDMGLKTIKTGAEIALQHRQQDHAERATAKE